MVGLGQSIVRFLDLGLAGILADFQNLIVIFGGVELRDFIIEIAEVFPQEASR